jgi:hypothetical protein
MITEQLYINTEGIKAQGTTFIKEYRVTMIFRIY